MPLSPCPAMRSTTQPHLFALSLSTLPCERDYSEPYSTPWAISPESVLPVGPSVVFSLIQYASVKHMDPPPRGSQFFKSPSCGCSVARPMVHVQYLDGKYTQTPLNIHKIHSVFDLEANTHNTPRRCILFSFLQIHKIHSVFGVWSKYTKYIFPI